jgi:formiminotetrahydrofolate cyclodeaminase
MGKGEDAVADSPPPTIDHGRALDSAFLQALAQGRPDPGGGAAAAHSGSLGLALLEKVCRLEHRRQRPQEEPGFPWGDLLARVRLVAAALLRLQAEDVEAYFQLTRARSQNDPKKLSAALEEAVACPLRIMQQAQEGLALLAHVAAGCALHLVSDLLVAGELLAAAFRGANHIARANLPLMPPGSRRDVWDEALAHTLSALETELQQAQNDLLRRQPCP